MLGIAFFTFLVAFMRATVYMHGESQIPRWTESKTSLIVGMVALGIGIGSPLVGFLSGGKVELGLVPIGAVGMIIATMCAAAILQFIPGLIACIVLMGFFTGFYIVPLFTLLQHRAPKASKGDLIATSNFVNVTGAILASLVFYGMDWAARATGVAPKLEQKDRLNRQGEILVRKLREVDNRDGRLQKVVLGRRLREIETSDTDEIEVSEATLIDVFRTPLQVGDEVIESRYELGGVTHHRLRRKGEPMSDVFDKHNMPRLLFLSAGGMTLATLLLLWCQLPDLFRRTRLWCRWLRRCRLEPVGVHHLPADGPVLIVTNADGADECDQVLCATDRTTRVLPATELGEASRALGRGDVVLLAGVDAQEATTELGNVPAPLLPVWIERVPENGKPKVYVVFGAPVEERSPAAVSEALQRTADEFRERLKTGTLAVPENSGGLH
jgi:hypothetical protein